MTHLERGWAKLDCWRGMYYRLGALMGPLMVTDGRYTSPGHIRGGLRQNDLYDNFRRAWLVFTHLERGWAKWGCYRGMYCRLGALMGAPMVTDGWYTSPGSRWVETKICFSTRQPFITCSLVRKIDQGKDGSGRREGYEYVWCLKIRRQSDRHHKTIGFRHMSTHNGRRYKTDERTNQTEIGKEERLKIGERGHVEHRCWI